jgi:hypothetical protein
MWVRVGESGEIQAIGWGIQAIGWGIQAIGWGIQASKAHEICSETYCSYKSAGAYTVNFPAKTPESRFEPIPKAGSSQYSAFREPEAGPASFYWNTVAGVCLEFGIMFCRT